MAVREIPSIAVLASGNGSNLQAILDRVADGSLPLIVRVVISDRKDARAMERARAAGVEALYVPPKESPNREAYDEKLVTLLHEREVTWVVLAGFMRILSDRFVRAFPARIINIHPAQLPKYPGLHAIERAYADREREIGVTVHFVDEGVDTGEVILQETVSVQVGESLETVTERVHQLEHRLYPEAIRRVIVEGGRS